VFHGDEQFVYGRARVAIHVSQSLQEFWRPARTHAHSFLQGADDQAVSADAERFGPTVYRLQQRIGNVHRGRHEYVYEYITIGHRGATAICGDTAGYACGTVNAVRTESAVAGADALADSGPLDYFSVKK
jgi:hypothetical protein